MDKKPSRQRVKHLRVPVLPNEIDEIKRRASSCGLSVAGYLRALGLNYQPKSILDANAVLELAKVNGDLGRLGGLLKMWLTNENRIKPVEQITALLGEIEATQAVLFEAARKV